MFGGQKNEKKTLSNAKGAKGHLWNKTRERFGGAKKKREIQEKKVYNRDDNLKNQNVCNMLLSQFNVTS